MKRKKKANEQWVRNVHADLLKYSIGTYAAVISGEKSTTPSLQLAYGDNLPKLEAAKKKYDPTNLFRLNRNIFDHLQ